MLKLTLKEIELTNARREELIQELLKEKRPRKLFRGSLELTCLEVQQINPRFKAMYFGSCLFDTQENDLLSYHDELALRWGWPLEPSDAPKLSRKGISDLEQQLLDDIRQGKSVTSNGDKLRTNALTKLRRNQLIKNKGTRSRPIWTLVTEENPYYDD